MYEALAYIGTWYIMSTVLSVYNKEVIGKKYGLLKDPNFPGGFPAPLMMSSVQFLGQYGLAVLGRSMSCAQTSNASATRTWNEYMTTVLPNGVATGLDIGFSNASLGFITLSFYTMCKSSAPLFLLLCAFIWRIEKPTWGLAGIVVVISIGLGMLVDGEVEFDFVGFLLVMSAAAMSGVRWTIAQVLLQGKPGAGHGSGNSALEVMEAVTPVMAVTAGLMSVIAEPLYRVWTESIYFSSLAYTALTFAMIGFGSLIAFFMVLVEFMLIGHTSALTFMVAGVFKEFLTIIVSHFCFGDELSWLNVCGLVVLVFGVMLFNIWKYNKLQEAKTTELKKNAGGGHEGDSVATGDDQQLLLSDGVNSSQNAGQEFELVVSAGHSPAMHRDSAHSEEPESLLSHPS